jgi:hypothetical protein
MRILESWIKRPAPRRVTWFLTGMFVFVLAGCGDRNPLDGLPLYPAKGRVMLADGKPLSAGRVVFVSTKPSVTVAATIDSDGRFAFKGVPGDGLPEAEYKIRIEPGSSSGTKGSKSKMNLPFATSYLDEDFSELKATITPDESKNTFEFKLGTKNTKDSTQGRGGR